MATEGGAQAVEKVGELVLVRVIPLPHNNVDTDLPLGCRCLRGLINRWIVKDISDRITWP